MSTKMKAAQISVAMMLGTAHAKLLISGTRTLVNWSHGWLCSPHAVIQNAVDKLAEPRGTVVEFARAG